MPMPRLVLFGQEVCPTPKKAIWLEKAKVMEQKRERNELKSTTR